jgi:hypothetical protein
MLNTKQPVLRRFWYAVMPVDLLKDHGRSRCSVNRSCCSSTPTANRPHSKIVAATVPPGFRRAGARTATLYAAITAGNMTATARS